MNRKKTVLIFLASLSAFCSTAQILSTSPRNIPSVDLDFTPGFIIQNHIHSIRGEYMFKPDGKIIEEQGIVHFFSFDSTSGLLTRRYETVPKGYKLKEIYHPAVYRRGKKIRKEYTTFKQIYVFDTLETVFRYDSLKRLIMKRSRTGDVYNADYFEYDSLGNISRHMVFRETNASADKSVFKLGIQTMLSTESYVYQRLTPSQVKKKFLNDEGKVYKEGILNYDPAGRILNENYSFIVSWMRSSVNYSYDELGRLTEKTETSNTGGDLKERFTFTYDSAGELYTKQFYRNDVLLHEYSFIYDDSKKLKSMLDRDFTYPAIWIIKYYYDQR